MLRNYGRKCGIELILFISVNNDQLNSEAGCSIANIAYLGVSGRVIGVNQNTDSLDLGNHFMQQPEPLGLKTGRELVDASDIATGPAEGRDKAGSDWIRTD